MNQITKKPPANLHYPEKFTKKVKTQIFWTFELGTQEGVNILVWIYVVFQKSDRQHDQKLNSETSYWIPATSAQIVIGTENYRDDSFLLNYNKHHYSRGYGQIKEAFRALTKDNILRPYISEVDSISSNDGNIIGYNMDSFDIRYQKSLKVVNRLK